MRLAAFQKQIGVLALTSLLVGGLVIYVITALQTKDKKSEAATLLSDYVTNLINQSKSNWDQKQEGKAINLDTDVIEPLTSAKRALSNLYEGTFATGGVSYSKPSSEDRKALIKTASVAIDKLVEQIKTTDEKAASQFNTLTAEVQNIINDYRVEAQASATRLSWLAGITAFINAVFLIALVALAYLRLRKADFDINESKIKLEDESKRVEQLTNFIEAMASGNYEMHIATNANDELSTTLISMRDKLKNNAEEEKRRTWSTTGLAKIGEILRETGNATELYDNIIKFLVKYTNSNQGGLFILDDNDPQNPALDLVAAYAFERKKFLTKRLDVGQGLVGQCFMEKERIHLVEVPDDYVRITSGLGGDRPTSCLMVPLKVNDKVFGVVELASFQLYPEHVVALVEKFAESIASTISNVKINESTRLLLEQTQQQAEEMKSQEEEMRQNMEELSATQEEMHRKEGEYIARIQDLEARASVLERV
jgi:GAF domain